LAQEPELPCQTTQKSFLTLGYHVGYLLLIYLSEYWHILQKSRAVSANWVRVSRATYSSAQQLRRWKTWFQIRQRKEQELCLPKPKQKLWTDGVNGEKGVVPPLPHLTKNCLSSPSFFNYEIEHSSELW